MPCCLVRIDSLFCSLTACLDGILSFDLYSLDIVIYASRILPTISLFGIRYCATSPLGSSVVLATHVDRILAYMTCDLPQCKMLLFPTVNNENYGRVRVNKFSTKHVFRQKKKGRAQQLWDACGNRTFSEVKQLDTTKVQPCFAIAVDESVTPRMPAMVPGDSGRVGSRMVVQVKRRKGRRASI